MAKRTRPRFSDMSLTSLRAYAKDELGITGLSKAPRGVVMAAVNAASQPKPMDNEDRLDVYYRQRRIHWLGSNISKLTARQRRRIRKNNRKARG